MRRLVVMVVVVAGVVTACAGEAGPSEFAMTEVIDFRGAGTFEVVEGDEVLGCRDGTVSALVTFDPDHLFLEAEKTYACLTGERDGTFTLHAVVVEADVEGSTNTWTITGATGDFVGLEGSGTELVVVDTDHTDHTVTGELDVTD